MIHEIKNFVANIKEEDFSRNLKLKEGLFIFVDIDLSGNLVSYEYELYKKNEPLNNFLLKILAFQQNTKPVSNAKIFNPGKKIFNSSCSPFAFAFNKKNTLQEIKSQKKKLKREEKGEEKQKIKNKIENKQQDIEDSVKQYFDTALLYVDEDYDLLFYENFKKFVYQYFQIVDNPPIIPFELRRVLVSEKSDLLISLFLKSLVIDKSARRVLTSNSIINVHQAYLTKKVFNKDDFNIEVEGKTFGISDSLSGFNDKKMFLKHHSAPLEYNYRVSGEVAMQLWRFFQLQKNKQIPNPVPIFVDKQELNEKMISIFNSEDKKIGHAEMIKKILNYSGQKDLQNYYLIYFLGTKGSRVADIDFIPVFRYEEKEAKIEEVFALGGRQAANNIENVFDLENHVFNRTFNGQLRTDTWLKYFGEIKYDPKYITDTCYNQLLRYRQSIYDFIYKSKRETITTNMFDDMMWQGILDDIRHDEVKEGNHVKEYAIKEKLNIWFSLYNFFTNTTQLNRKNMANRTHEILNQLQELSDTENDTHFRDGDDEAFAFASGQIIWKLLIQSKSSIRTHALLEPFLQKVDVFQFKLAIARTFEMYKHEFTLYPKKYRFDKIMSEVMGYEPIENNMKKLLPFILAGYFAKSIFSKDQED